MLANKFVLTIGVVWLIFAELAIAQNPQEANKSSSTLTLEEVDQLRTMLKDHEARIKELESQLAARNNPQPPPFAIPELVPEVAATQHDHISLGGGAPKLIIRGFTDINLGTGTGANPLIFPLGAKDHTNFQLGEFDLFISSKLSKQLSFLGEVVIGTDHTNSWGVDIERMQLTYRQSPYFEISGGRYHTAIGYYNTQFHHGTWFQTTTGRPFMYYFEDSGGMLPVHSIGITTTGMVPGTQKWGLHWIAEAGNGRSSDPNEQPVQNFHNDRDRLDYNLALYIKPEWAPGLQLGGNYYSDQINPPGLPHVHQRIPGAYVVYSDGTWEFFNEAALINNRFEHVGVTHHTPLMYSQISRKFGIYRPYLRFQYVNSPASDPVNVFAGRYEGPSAGLRIDVTKFSALKIQYNRLYQGGVQKPANAFDTQVAFTF